MENLDPYRKNVYSQAGEDGIVEYLCDRLGFKTGWCVEFGAWDGKHLSNTRNLILNRGWSAVMVEGDEAKFTELKKEYASNPAVHSLCRMVGFRREDPNCLDAVLSETPLPREFEFLSIDVDGNDWYIWDSLKDYSAKIVVIEANSSIPPDESRVAPAFSGGGASAKALVELGREKGYELVAHTGNCIFVRKALYPKVGLDDNRLERLFDRRFLKSRPSWMRRLCGALGLGKKVS